MPVPRQAGRAAVSDQVTAVFTVRLAAVRKARGMSRRQLARLSGVSESSITSIENGTSGTTLATAGLLAAALKVPFTSMFEGFPGGTTPAAGEPGPRSGGLTAPAAGPGLTAAARSASFPPLPAGCGGQEDQGFPAEPAPDGSAGGTSAPGEESRLSQAASPRAATGRQGRPADGAAVPGFNVAGQVPAATGLPEPRLTFTMAEPGKGVWDAGDESALFQLRREIWDLPVIARLTIRGEPVSKSRARFTKQGSKTQAYTPEKTSAAEQVVAWHFRRAAPGHLPDPEKTYGVMAIFFCGTRQRRDADNMLKLILDALNGLAWPDDSQVTEVSAKKTLTAPEHARTEVLVYEVGLVQRFTARCPQCGDDFVIYPSRNSAVNRHRYCSAECAGAARQTVDRTPKPCANCGTTFTPTGQQPKYCSAECGNSAGRVTVACSGCGTEFTKQKCHVKAANYCSPECQQAAVRAMPLRQVRGTCETCGAPTSKSRYRQCRACRLSGMDVAGRPDLGRGR
jgi:crossover junction endodeoxyribonuclease RusA